MVQTVTNQLGHVRGQIGDRHLDASFVTEMQDLRLVLWAPMLSPRRLASSAAVCAIEWYSTWVEERATDFCLLELQEIAFLSKNTM